MNGWDDLTASVDAALDAAEAAAADAADHAALTRLLAMLKPSGPLVFPDGCADLDQLRAILERGLR
jgi:hypothetical protein